MHTVTVICAYVWGVICGFAAYQTLTTPAHGRERVIASTYGDYRDATSNKHIRYLRSRVATGAVFDANGMTAAHRTLPFGSIVTLKHYHRVVDVKINDRGPFVRGRTFDLTPAASKFLQCGGLCWVEVKTYPPLPKPRPDIPEPMFAWGEEVEP